MRIAMTLSGKAMPAMKRMLFFKFLLLLLLLLWPDPSASEGVRDPIGEYFEGEVLKYDIGFWIFSRVGEGVATFHSLGHGRYAAFHEGRTLGFVGWITRYRRDVF